MNPIVEDMVVNKPHVESEYMQKLRDCGFSAPVAGYPVITMSSIQAYLEKIARGAVESGERFDSPSFYPNNIREMEFIKNISRSTLSYSIAKDVPDEFDYFFSKKPYVRTEFEHFQANWLETPVELYKGFPPSHVLSSMEKAKGKFDEIKIVIVTAREKVVPDPLVVGINKNDENRYLIDYWDKDIDPTELIKQ